MLRNKLMKACSVAVLAAALYGCSSSSDDGANMQVQDLQDQIAALEAALGEGQELTPEALAALIQAKVDAEAALALAMSAQEAAAAAQMTAEGERDTANMAAAAAATAQMTAEGERDTANMAAAAAATAQMTAEGERDAANTAEAAAEIARMAAVEAQETAVAAQGMAETDRDAANMRATQAMAAETLAMTAATEAGQRAGAAEAAQATAEGERDAANMRATDAEAAATLAKTAETDADQRATAAEGERDAAITRAETAEADLKAAQDELAGLETDLADEIAAGALKDRIARADEVQEAITPAADAKMVPAGVDVTAKHSAARAVTVDVNGVDDDVYEGGETTAGSGDWNSVMMTRTNADATDTTDTLVIYTDIDAPADVPIKTRYTVDGTSQLDQALMFVDGTDLRVGKAQSDGFPSGPGDMWEYGPEGRAKTVLGTFDGVPGQFECIPATCMVAADNKGKLKSSVGWRFTPRFPLDATVKVPDANYAYFGWWLNKPKASDDPHGVRVFAGASAAPVEVTTLMDGTARYTGPAAGKYVTKTFTAGVQTEAGVGHFTATTKLTAKFGDEDAPGGSISGTVTSFTLDDVSAAPWKVTLGTAMFGDNASSFTGRTEVNFGGGLTTTPDAATAEDMPAGTWQGTFYDAAPATPAGGAPNTVIGTFDAATDDKNAFVIGAFGTKKQ